MINFISSGGLLVIFVLGYFTGRTWLRHVERHHRRQLAANEEYRRELAAWWESIGHTAQQVLPPPPRPPEILPRLAPAAREKLLTEGPFR